MDNDWTIGDFDWTADDIQDFDEIEKASFKRARIRPENPEGKRVKRRVSPKSLAKRIRNARARRKLEKLRDDKMLRVWIAEVWDEPIRGF
jgi:hypothetical protein